MWGFIVIGVVVGLLIAFLLLMILLSFFPLIAQLIDPILISFLKDVLGPVSAGFGGAVAGAYAAYYLQRKAQLEKEDNDSARVLYMAKFLYIEKMNEILSIKQQAFVPYFDHKARFSIIGQLPDREMSAQPVDHNLIALLVAQGAGKAVSDVFLAEKRYIACFANFKARNAMITSYREVASTVSPDENLIVNFEKICRVVDAGVIIALYEFTEGLLKNVDDTVTSIRDALLGISEALDRQMKDKGLPNVEIEFPEIDLIKPAPPPFFTKESLIEFVIKAKR
ncbi:hypothetical protein [uncultured Pseudomonas sp.]|uniref:hypothetical protein n=1 Tax=uncultured Pseudomonas sp. TaxID=114707 RepID=UPI0025DA7B6B|nr:hypothetical protein [uncultured Pseudomonas sp.]